MKGKYKNWVIIAAIIIILMIPIIINFINSKKVKVITFEDFYTNISKTGFSLMYFGTTEKDEYNDYKKTLVELKNKYKIDVATIDINRLNEKEKEKLIELSEEFKNQNIYCIIRDGEIIYVSSNKLTIEDLGKLVDKYYNNIIAKEDIAYKTVSTYKEYMTLVSSKKTIMAVFGRNSCGWCNKFKPVYNDVAAEYNLDIYYFDSDSFNSAEYSKILNSGLTIPAKCSRTKTEVPLSNGFGTPLTLFTKSGKTVGCIGGYTNKTGLINELKNVGILK